MNKTTAASGTQSVTTKLAAEVAETPFDAIPGSALEAIKRLVIDHVGITYMGAVFTGEALIAYAQELGGRPESVLIGAGIKVPAELAAGINAQLCRNTDFEETGPGTHVGPLIAHTALAVGQRVGASGRDVLAAAALGYALCARFHFARSEDWPRTSVVHHRTAAAAIASRLLGHGSRTHITFFQGDNKFGKVAMSYPVNYDPPDLIPRSEAPNIGYIAQAFEVADLSAAEEACVRAQAKTYAPRMEIDLPGIGTRHVTAVRNPASGAITMLMEAL